MDLLVSRLCKIQFASVSVSSPSASYTVKFYDGVIQTVKGMHVKPYIKEVTFSVHLSIGFFWPIS